MPVDISINNQGSIVLLEPLTDAGRAWVKEHIGEDNGYQLDWPTVLCDHRYAWPIVKGMWEDGLVVE